MRIEDLHVSVADAGRLTGVHRAEAYRRAHEGVWPTMRVGRQLRVPIAALFELKESNQEEVPAEIDEDSNHPIGVCR